MNGVAPESARPCGTSDLMQARLSDSGAAGALALDEDSLWWVHGGVAAGALVITPADSGIRGDGTTLIGTIWMGVNRHFRAGSVSLSIGPELRLNDRERTVALDGETVFKLPQLSAGVTLMLGFKTHPD